MSGSRSVIAFGNAFRARRGINQELAEAYAGLWQCHGASHALTISLGTHPSTFDPECNMIPQLRRVLKELTHQVRGVPKRSMPRLRPEDAIFMAGFYEAQSRGGVLFPHWHGVVALHAGEEEHARYVLADCVGKDETPGALNWGATTRPVITTPRSKPTFHLSELRTSPTYARYASKSVDYMEATHWTTWDLLSS